MMRLCLAAQEMSEALNVSTGERPSPESASDTPVGRAFYKIDGCDDRSMEA